MQERTAPQPTLTPPPLHNVCSRECAGPFNTGVDGCTANTTNPPSPMVCVFRCAGLIVCLVSST
jgi:hypothetical protein